ncbi:MAG: hypothetical protein MHM6MM_002813 [Cercozoa sp. M6MM]
MLYLRHRQKKRSCSRFESAPFRLQAASEFRLARRVRGCHGDTRGLTQRSQEPGELLVERQARGPGWVSSPEFTIQRALRCFGQLPSVKCGLISLSNALPPQVVGSLSALFDKGDEQSVLLVELQGGRQLAQARLNVPQRKKQARYPASSVQLGRAATQSRECVLISAADHLWG